MKIFKSLFGNESNRGTSFSGKGFGEGANGSRIYLDYASITPVDPAVFDLVRKTGLEFPANPSSLYAEGVDANNKLQEARSSVAKTLDAHADEIYFTSGGTESDNLAITGLLKGFLANPELKARLVGKDGESVKPHIISTNIEHPAIREIMLHLSNIGVCDISFIPVEENGIVNPKDIRMALRPETILVSVMYVNNEIGTIQPLHEIAKMLRYYKKEVGRTQYSFPYLHTDACQGAQYCSLRAISLGVDIMSLDGSKIYGPRGCGVLYVRRGVSMHSIGYGGDQESGIRPGTENVASAVGFAKALADCQKNSDGERDTESARVQKLRDDLLVHIQAELGKKNIQISVNGDMHNRVPNNINICLPGIDSEFAVLKLDAHGIAVSSVTSCRSKKEDSSSYVVEALERVTDDVSRIYDKDKDGHRKTCSRSSLRITLGKYTTEKEIAKAKEIFVKVISRLYEFI